MIVFKNPKISSTASGHNIIELTEDGTWENFPGFAKLFIEQIGARKINEANAVDVRFWDIEVKGIILSLGYEDFPNCITIMSDSENGDKYLKELYENLKENSNIEKGV